MNLIIKPVTALTYHDILSLNVASGQEHFIETTADCLLEATQCSFWRPVGIYDADALIGFAMYGLFKEEGSGGRVWLDRFLIDAHYQGMHYGETSLVVLKDRLVNEYNCSKIYLSLYEDNKIALALYQKHGFRFNGELDIHGEKVMEKDVNF